MTAQRRVDVFDIATPEQRAEYEELVNNPDHRISDTRDMPMATGAILRIVDHIEDPKPRPGEFNYVPPIC
jgi:hypothetical protein